MAEFCFAAGAAEASIHEITAEYFSRKGFIIDPPDYEQRLRCLVFSYGDILTVILNADWDMWLGEFANKVRLMLEADTPHRKLQLLCFGANNLNWGASPWEALCHRDKTRRDVRFEEQILKIIMKLFRDASQKLCQAKISAGSGTCAFISGNSFWGKEHCDTNVYVLRIDDAENNLIASVVNFSCRVEASGYELSGGFPTAMESMVQKIYGRKIPVLFMNGTSGDVYPAILRNPLDFANSAREEYLKVSKRILSNECDRFGRVLGGEVCKVLAELEVAGRPLQVGCQRWDRVAWEKGSAGILIERPTPVLKSLEVRLEFRPPKSLEECEERANILKEKIKPLERTLPYKPRCYAPYLLNPDDRKGELYRWMELRAEWWYWNAERGRAKQAQRLKKAPERLTNVRVLVFSRDVAAVCFPGWMCYETAATIKKRSPFAITLIWGGMDPSNVGLLIPQTEAILGGHHSSFFAYAQGSIDQMVSDIAEVLCDIYRGMNKGENSGVTEA